MSNLLARLAAFRINAKAGPIKINIHAPETPGVPNRSPSRFILYAALVAAGFVSALTTMQPVEENHQAGVEIQADQGEDEAEPELKYIDVTYRGKTVQTLDASSRLRLVKAAAQEQALDEDGLTWRDLYGVIHAETAWISRDGKGKNGVTSHGLAQLEPNTAKALNITDPNNPASAVRAAAALMKEAAAWSRAKIRKIPKKEHATKLREGVSIYYNLSTRGRNQWNGHNTAEMPIETRAHITNAKDGARIAHQIGVKIEKDAGQQVRDREQVQSPKANHGLNMKYAGALSGEASLSETLKKMLSIASTETQEFRAGAKLLGSLIDDTCPNDGSIYAKGKAQDACVIHHFGLKGGRQLLSTLKVADAKLLGSYKGNAVLLTADKAGNAASLVLNGKESIILDLGLLRLMQGPNEKQILQFILAHENGHLALRHMSGHAAPGTLNPEVDADEHAIETLLEDGFTLNEVQKAVDGFAHGFAPAVESRPELARNLGMRHQLMGRSIQARIDQQNPNRQAMR